MNRPPFNFLWPEMLWLLALLPVLVLLYIWLLSRRKKNTLRFSTVSLVKEAMGRGASWRRHVPPALLLLALGTLFVATARPTAIVSLPSTQKTIILAMDVSGSMRAADVQPNRLVASQEAAKAFLTELPRDVKVGVVSFAGTAAIVSGVVLSLAALFPEDNNIDLQAITGARAMPAAPNEAPKVPFTPVEPGSFGSAAIILLTDGQRTTGPDPMDAAKMAAERGIRVYTVGIGTKDGEIIGFEGWSMRVRLDEETLKNISAATRAEYFYAGTAADLKQVYQSLSTRLVVETKETEVSALFATLGALLVVLAGGLSVWWFGRIT
jgi:Ca-activated chloride channel homolog